MMRIWSHVHYTVAIEVGGIKKRALLKAALDATCKTLSQLPRSVRRQLDKSVTYSLSVSFTSPAKMKELNKKYRQKNIPTDVLSFSRLEGPKHPTPFPEVGDVIICLKVAELQAREYGVSLKQEVERLAVHGVLHLFGYDHEKSLKEEKRMFAIQNKILRLLS